MATKAKSKAKVNGNKLTITRAKEMFNEFVNLLEQGQFDARCCDAEAFVNEVREMLNRSKKYNYIKLEVSLCDVELPASFDIDNDELEVNVSVKGKNIPIQEILVTDSEEF